MKKHTYLVAIGALTALLLATACSPSLSPLYRDFEIAPSDTSLNARIAAALIEAGWDTVSTDVPNAVTTDEKVLSNWGIYRVSASLEVTPLGRNHVRVFVHPYRQYFIGGRGKIPYLTRPLASKFLPALNTAFRKHGIHGAGTLFERDDRRMQ